MEASADLVERQIALQREAAEVVRELRVEETLGRLGRVVAIGSFVTRLTTWRDLDFVVDASGLTTGAAFEAMYPLLARSRAVRYENDKELQRHYFVLRIPWRDDEWKLDVSIFLAGIPPDIEELQDELHERMTDETRLTILALKDAWHKEAAYPDVVGGFEIYDAVLNHGVHSLDRFDAYARTRPPGAHRLTPGKRRSAAGSRLSERGRSSSGYVGKRRRPWISAWVSIVSSSSSRATTTNLFQTPV